MQKFLLVDAMTAFDLSILFRPPGFDVPQADPGFLYGESKGEREFGAIIDLDFPTFPSFTSTCTQSPG